MKNLLKSSFLKSIIACLPFLALILTLTLTGCSEDNESPDAFDKVQLIGTWYAVQESVTGCQESSDNVDRMHDQECTVPSFEPCSGISVTFTEKDSLDISYADIKGLLSYSSGESNAKFEVKDENTLEYCTFDISSFAFVCKDVRFELDGDELTLIFWPGFSVQNSLFSFSSEGTCVQTLALKRL
ncbi:MAG: hypothetical protein AAF849_03855 [Bacteroidota bacterium]